MKQEEYKVLGKKKCIFFWKVFSAVSGCVSFYRTTETFWSIFPLLYEEKKNPWKSFNHFKSFIMKSLENRKAHCLKSLNKWIQSIWFLSYSLPNCSCKAYFILTRILTAGFCQSKLFLLYLSSSGNSAYKHFCCFKCWCKILRQCLAGETENFCNISRDCKHSAFGKDQKWAK